LIIKDCDNLLQYVLYIGLFTILHHSAQQFGDERLTSDAYSRSSMDVTYGSTLVNVVLVLLVLILIYKYHTSKFSYWSIRGVYSPKTVPVFGNIVDLLLYRTSIGVWLKNYYDSTDGPYFGLFAFGQPYFIVRCPKLIKQILIKDFGYFADRHIAAPGHDELISNLLLFQKNPDWRGYRSKISPIFTSGRLRTMFQEMKKSGEALVEYIGQNVEETDAKDLLTRYSGDILGKCVFCIDTHSFEDQEFSARLTMRSAFAPTWRNALVQLPYFICQNLVNLLHLNFFYSAPIELGRDMFTNVLMTRQSDRIKSHDMIHLINELKRNKEFCKHYKFDGDRVLALCMMFFIAGFETISSTIAFTLWELCMNPEIQSKLRHEILMHLKDNSEIDYQKMMEMEYLNMCVFETLRKYPVLPFLDRVCARDYKVPGSDLVIERGTPVYIPMYALHFDEKYFPQPEKYMPERFKNGKSCNRDNDGLVYIPFGDGPRLCAGERFGLIGSKVGLIHILLNYEVQKTDNSPQVMEFSPKSFLLHSKVGLPMRFKKLNTN
ncbi:unnamed protein product, partial [Acanthoscelides obtectus]